MQIKVYGTPAPQGSKSFVGVTRTGRGIMKESSDDLAPWRADVMLGARLALADCGNPPPMSGALRMSAVFTFLRPASIKPKQRLYPSVPPDLSKLVRGVEDALKAAGVIEDDKLIVEYTRVLKVYCGEYEGALDRSGCIIDIEEITP